MNHLHLSRAAVILLTAALVTACQREARSVDFFVADEPEAKRVQEACTSGSIRGLECEYARTALATIAANRMLDYKPAPATEKR